MGDIKRKKKKYSRPKKLFDSPRISEEKGIVKKYGLKNKREIWKAEAEISKLRRRAKLLIPKTPEEQEKFFNKLRTLGFDIKAIADVLGLTTEDWLDRRLQSFVVKLKLATTPKQARQLIVHKGVLVDGTVVNIPSFFVSADLEKKIKLKERKAKPKKVAEAPVEEATPAEEVKEEKAEEAKE